MYGALYILRRVLEEFDILKLHASYEEEECSTDGEEKKGSESRLEKKGPDTRIRHFVQKSDVVNFGK